MTKLKDSDRLLELEERVRILALENDHLAERAEETLLLGLFAEKLSLVENRNDLLGEALEQIAILKDIPFAACCELGEGGSAAVLRFCCLGSSDEQREMSLALAPRLLADLESGSVYLEDGQGGSTSGQHEAPAAPGRRFTGSQDGQPSPARRAHCA